MKQRLIEIIFNSPVRSSKKTPPLFTITKISSLIQFKEEIAVYNENITPKNTRRVLGLRIEETASR
jgi:hypothetical protein